MSMYSPTFLEPNGIAINGSGTHRFSWEVNTTGTDVQVAFQLKVYRNDNNALVYDSGKITSSMAYFDMIGGTLPNIGTYSYKWRVQTWKDGTTSATSDWYLFKCNSEQVVTFSVPSIITVQQYDFTATYSQTEGVKLKYYQFLLYDDSAIPVLVYDTGIVYSTDTNISETISGLLEGQVYNIKLITTTQNDIVVETPLQQFTPNYVYTPTPSYLIVTPNNLNGLMKLEWQNLKYVMGVVSGGYDYDIGKFNLGLHLHTGATLTYAQECGLTFTLIFWVKLRDDNFFLTNTGQYIITDDGFYLEHKHDPQVPFVGKIVEMFGTTDPTNTIEVGYDGTRFYFKQSYRIVASSAIPMPGDYFLIGIQNNKLIIVTDTVTEIVV